MALKLRAKVPFPPFVVGLSPIAVTKANGIWTISIDPTAIADVIPSTIDQPNEKVIYWNSITKQVNVISIAEIVALAAAQAGVTRVITTAGTVTVAAGDTVIALNKSVASVTSINLPSVAARNPLGLALEIYDFAGNAGPITINPLGAETIMGANGAWTVFSGGSAQTGGSTRLIPSTTLNGWLLR